MFTSPADRAMIARSDGKVRQCDGHGRAVDQCCGPLAPVGLKTFVLLANLKPARGKEDSLTRFDQGCTTRRAVPDRPPL